MYKLGYIQTKTYPTQKELLNILKKADDDNADTRDTRDMMLLAQQIFSIYPRIGGHYLTRSTALRSFAWDIVPFDKKDDEKAKEVKAVLNSAINIILDKQCDVPFFGSFAVNITWENQQGFRPVKVNAIEAPFVEQLKTGVNILDAESDKLKRVAELNFDEPVQDYIFDVDRIQPKTGGVMRTIFFTELMRYDGLVEFGNYIRKLKGILQILNKGGSDEDQAAAEDAAKNAVKNNYLVTSEFIEMKLNEITTAQGTSFKDFIESHKSDISIACLGQANISDISKGSGSRAALQVQRLVSADICYADQLRVENLINTQLLLHYYHLNFSKSDNNVPWQFKFNVTEEYDFEKRVIALTDLLRAGVQLPADEFYNAIGFTRPAGTPDIITMSNVNNVPPGTF